MKLDASGVTKTSDVKAGSAGFLNEKGGWHFLIRKCEEGDDFFDVELEVLAGTVPGNEGKLLTARYYKETQEGEVNPGLLKFALASRIIQPGEARNVDLEQEAPGKTFKANTWLQKSKEGKTKEYCRISMNDQWAVDDDDAQAKAIPTGDIPGSDNGHTNGSQPAAAGSSGGGSDWDSLV